jgi:hypothetical protein
VAEQPDRKRPAKGNDKGAKAQESPRERRASHRVEDDQQSGEGSLSALSKLKMIERKNAPWRKVRDDI